MWTNWETTAFIDWLKKHHTNSSNDKRISVYGLDVFSFRESMNSIIQHLKKHDIRALAIVKKAIEYHEPYSKDEGQSCPRASAFVTVLCEKEILNLLTEIRKNYLIINSDTENVMSTEQNTFVARNAEK